MDIDNETKTKLWLMAAGLAGGFITLTTSKQEMTFKQRIAYLISALFVALFITPWACEYFGITSTTALTGLGFTMGAFWQIVVARGAEFIQNWRRPGNNEAQNG